MDHVQDIRLDDPTTWDLLKVDVADYLLQELQLADLYPRDRVEKCIGIVRTNGIQATDQAHNGVK